MQEATLSQMERRVEESKKSWSGCPGRGGDGRGTFIHSSSFIFPPPLLLLFAALKLYGGGARWDTLQFSTVREGALWGLLHAILVKGVRETC